MILMEGASIVGEASIGETVYVFPIRLNSWRPKISSPLMTSMAASTIASYRRLISSALNS